MRNLILLSIFCAGCFDYAGLSTEYGRDGATAATDLARSSGDDLARADLGDAPTDLASSDGATCTGECVPGATQDGVCGPCSQQVCGADCHWNACSLRPGNACEVTSTTCGLNLHACTCNHGSNPSGMQWCYAVGNSCQWSACQNYTVSTCTDNFNCQ